MKTHSADKIYKMFRYKIVDQNMDLRILTGDLADALLDKAMELHDNEMIESLELFFGA